MLSLFNSGQLNQAAVQQLAQAIFGSASNGAVVSQGNLNGAMWVTRSIAFQLWSSLPPSRLLILLCPLNPLAGAALCIDIAHLASRIDISLDPTRMASLNNDGMFADGI